MCMHMHMCMHMSCHLLNSITKELLEATHDTGTTHDDIDGMARLAERRLQHISANSVDGIQHKGEPENHAQALEVIGPRGPVSGNGRTWPEPNGSGRRGSAATGSGAPVSILWLDVL